MSENRPTDGISKQDHECPRACKVDTKLSEPFERRFPKRLVHFRSQLVWLFRERGGLNEIAARFGFAWVTAGFFLISFAGHWLFGWFAYVNEQQAHKQPIEVSQYLVQMSRDMFENWQSEFLQLLWQVGGLAILLHVGSPQSKEGDDRVEAKIDAILLAVDRKDGERVISDIDALYEGRHTDTGLAKQRALREERGRLV